MKLGNEQRFSGPIKPTFVEKSWGHEIIYSNELYCCKLLHIKPGQQTSLHFHIDKEETMVVVSGTLRIDYIYNKQKSSYILKEQEAFVIAPGLVHTLICEGPEPVTFIEASTISHDTDSIRIG